MVKVHSMNESLYDPPLPVNQTRKATQPSPINSQLLLLLDP